MRVDALSLEGFRNYIQCETELAPGINVVTGENAQGKTNLLEAVYMLSCGRSFRTRFDRELINFCSDFARIRASVFSGGRGQSIDISLQNGRKKQLLANGAKKNSAGLSEIISAVLFCPDDLNLIKDGASARRRLMDMAISQLRPGYAALASEYARLYEHKTRILKDWREAPRLLDVLEDISAQLSLCSARMIRYRASFVRKLNSAAAPVHEKVSGGREVLELTYKTVSTVTDPTAPVEEVLAQVMEHQASHRDAELSTGSCLTGAHKDDILIGINGLAARSFASQGQTRTAALSIKLAEREIHLEDKGEYPILLLDDVLSELDAARQEFVLSRISGGQTIITCCEDEKIMSRTGGKVLFVRDGRII